MDAKITVTTRCNAKCKTCPVWTKPKEDMSVERFMLLLDKINRSRTISRVLLNNTGDAYNHPESNLILKAFETLCQKTKIMTTNAGEMDYVPKVDMLIISFNGGTEEAYEYTTGLSYKKTVQRVKDRYKQIRERAKIAEIHCLIWEGNQGTEEQLLELWRDFPGRVRVSYKYDNQMQTDRTVNEYKDYRQQRIPCDYLAMMSIMPSGRLVSCAHDFDQVTDFGNVFETENIDSLWNNPERKTLIEKHLKGEYPGICEKCNYNTPIAPGMIRYLK